ncbi:Protein VPRBP [Thelohanellus kitauei]|uniref:Protein VPRBP n=1 Tax=Thelohanellus kitauei TaxID=669202 RepID=A0A0C2MDK3_THEKT|nr:Protein VPRBP [Thelohanellus kitauei]
MWDSHHFLDIQFDFPPDIFKKVLLSCIPSFEGEHNLIFADYAIFMNEENHSNNIIKDHISLELFNDFIKNSYAHYFWDTIFEKHNLNKPNEIIIDALHCLILMKANERFADSLSGMNHYHQKLCCTGLQRYCSLSSDESCYQIYKYAKRLFGPSGTYKFDEKVGIFTRLDRRNNSTDPQPFTTLFEISQIRLSKFMNNEKVIFGIDKELQINFFNVEHNRLQQKIGNKSAESYYILNIPDINYEDSIILSNGDLFCIRSNKMIHQFPHLNHKISGIFSPSFNEVILHSEIYDLRTLRLREQVSSFKNILIKRTYDDNLLIGQITNWLSPLSYPVREAKDFFSHKNQFGKKAYIFDSKTYSTIFNHISRNWVKSFDINRSGTSICIGESTDRHRPLSNIVQIYEDREINDVYIYG